MIIGPSVSNRLSLSVLYMTLFILTGCLPGEEDVMINYNKINQDAQIENTGLSLTQAANDLTASLVASATKRKIPLGSKETIKEDEPTVSFAAPSVPAGTKVAPCGDFGAVAYFTALPKGITNMAASGPVMVAALSKRFNSRHVGINTASGVQLPEIATDLGCGVSGDILVGSPIFVTGFGYGESSLPDRRKARQPNWCATSPCRAPAV